MVSTRMVEPSHKACADRLVWSLLGAIGLYLVFDILVIFLKPKVMTSGIEGSDQWGNMPNLLVCHDVQYHVQWRAADMFVRHFDNTSSGHQFNVTEHEDFEISVTDTTTELPGQGGSCLNFSTHSSLKPFSTSPRLVTSQAHVAADPMAWYVFDFHVSRPETAPEEIGVPNTLYLIAEDATGHQSLLGTTPHLLSESHDEVASTMIEIKKVKRIRDGDFTDLAWTHLTTTRVDYDYHGIEHTVRVSNVNSPLYTVDCAASSAEFCTTSAEDVSMAVVQLVMSTHDVEILHKMGPVRRLMMAFGAAGGFMSIVTLIYNKFVVKKFKPSYHDVLTMSYPFGDGVAKTEPEETHEQLMENLIKNGKAADAKV